MQAEMVSPGQDARLCSVQPLGRGGELTLGGGVGGAHRGADGLLDIGRHDGAGQHDLFHVRSAGASVHQRVGCARAARCAPARPSTPRWLAGRGAGCVRAAVRTPAAALVAVRPSHGSCCTAPPGMHARSASTEHESGAPAHHGGHHGGDGLGHVGLGLGLREWMGDLLGGPERVRCCALLQCAAWNRRISGHAGLMCLTTQIMISCVHIARDRPA